MMQRKSYQLTMNSVILDVDVDDMLERIECMASAEDIATKPRKQRNLHYELVTWSHGFRDDVTSRYLEE